MEQDASEDTVFASRLHGFVFERILLEEPEKCRLTFPAILRIEKSAIPLDVSQHIFPGTLGGFLSKVKCMESTDIYMWLVGWISASSMEKQPQGDVKVSIICPATEVHIRKYSKQSSILVRETPDIYRRIVQPYISDLYLIAIVRDRNLRSLRDLRATKALGHIALLKCIRHEASTIAQDKWGIPHGGLRMYIHYQPSYYHFHVHIVNANYEAGMGMIVGQAHLLDDVIALLELDEENPSESLGIFERITLTYGLGEQHGLYDAMKAVQAEI
ncbi:scavenger mRNA decapping enzyme [Mycena leptocephala]|nr:scavenger mRNA decapping enzyme [Mycena leptocephala]